MNQTSRARRGVLRWILTAAAVLVPLTAVHAHDFWLEPDAFRIASGESVRVRGETSSHFPTSASHSPSVSDSAAVAGVVDRFHRALTEGDSATALSLLTPDAVILETGGIETKEEYRGHHLPSDIAFAQAVRSERGPMGVVVRGDVAWATSTSVARGEFRGRPINSQNAELAVLTRTPEGWLISAIHWSSRQLRQ